VGLDVIAAHQGLLVVLSGPSGVGKGTVVTQAMASPKEAAARLRRSISVTTRPPRADEVEGEHYFFRTAEQFEAMAQQGALLEWAAYLDQRYGTPRDWVDRQLASGYDVVLEIEVNGARQVRRRRPDAVLIYMLPPSTGELQRRLVGRGSDSAETQRRRLEVAQQEIACLREYDYAIVNDDVVHAADRLLDILEAERWRVSRLDLSPLSEEPRD
jgi:guanylate kinase